MDDDRDPAHVLEEVLGTLVEWHEQALNNADYLRYMLKHGADFDKTYPPAIYEMNAINFENLINYIRTGRIDTGPIAVVREVGD